MSGDRPGRAWSRRDFLWHGGAAVALSPLLLRMVGCTRAAPPADVFIARVGDYDADIRSAILAGLAELEISAADVRGRRILLKPNLVEPHLGLGHINTHPAVLGGMAQALRTLGASEVMVAEGPGHCMDTRMVLEESRLAHVLDKYCLGFVDLNYDDGFAVPNRGGYSKLGALVLPRVLQEIDLVVSVAKMKTHHWAGVTLGMKNLFGLMPGAYYGWPKNVLHYAGLAECIIDINLAVRPWLCVVDGIVGMEGDGPIMGTPRQAEVLVLGQSPVAVDATCARVMGIDPRKVRHLAKAPGALGPVDEPRISQRGEAIASVRTDFALVDRIPAHRGLRLKGRPTEVSVPSTSASHGGGAPRPAA